MQNNEENPDTWMKENENLSDENNQANGNGQKNPNKQTNGNGQWNPNNQTNGNGQWNPNNQMYQNPLYGMQRSKVPEVFNILFLVTLVIKMLLAMIQLHLIEKSVTPLSVMHSSYGNPLSAILSVLALLIGVAELVFMILDIYNVSKAGYKIVGLVLFGILLRPGYFIWRAYVLGKEKVIPIIITVVLSILTIVYIVFATSAVFTIMINAMNYLNN